MKKIICLFVFLAGFSIIQAQNTVDSLINELNTRKLTPKEELILLDTISHIYTGSNAEKAIPYSERGLKIAGKERDKLMLSKFNQHMGIIYTYKGVYDTSKVYLDKALEYAIDIKDGLQETEVYMSMGACAARSNNYPQALEYFMKVLAYYESKGNKKRTMSVLNNIATTHRVMLNPSRAVFYLQQAKDIAEELNDPAGKMKVYYNLGAIYYGQNEFDKALEYQLKGLELAQETGNLMIEAACLNALAMLYAYEYQEYDKAQGYALRGLEIAEIMGDPYNLVGALSAISNVYLFQERFKECEEAALRAWAIDSTINNLAPNLIYNMAVANIQMGNKIKGLQFLKRYETIKEEVIDKSHQETLMDMEVKYETEKKEMRIAILEKEKTLYIWLGIAGIAILLLAFGLLFFRHRLNIQKRKLAEQQVKQLEQENQLIATQAILDGETAERSRLARDLHDGLGGMLSVVKLNLKDMKGFSIMDGPDITRFDKAIKMLDESIDELRRVAHHMMPESLMRYGLKVSLEDFCRAIPGAHFQYFGGDPRLDSRLEVLIYRCTYELVNNAVKHADATTINIQLMIDNGVVSLTVQDNGVGFDPETVSSGAGLENIRTRVSAYNGKMNVYSSPGKGTEVSIEIEQV